MQVIGYILNISCKGLFSVSQAHYYDDALSQVSDESLCKHMLNISNIDESLRQMAKCL